jgi:hypothetical protein
MRRLAPVIAVAVLLTAAPHAVGAPKACRLVVDPKGDDRVNGDTRHPALDDVYDDSDLDVVSADLATDARNVTAVVRLATLRQTDPDSPTGRMYWFSFVAGEQRYTLSATLGADGTSGIVYRETKRYEDGSTGVATGEGIGSAVVRPSWAKAELTITAPLSVFAPHTPLTRDRLLRELQVFTFHHYGTGGQRHEAGGRVVLWGSGGAGDSVDIATSKKTYAPGSPSCVAVGR